MSAHEHHHGAEHHRAAKFWDRFAPKGHDHAHAHEGLQHNIERAVARLQANDRVLEVGCAAGAASIAMRPHVARVHGIDISPTRIAEAKQAEVAGLTFAATTLEDSALDGEEFTAVVMFNVLHHLDAEASLRRCFDLLPSGGLLIMEDVCLRDAGWFARVGLALFARLMRVPPMHHHTAAELEAIVARAGFDVTTSEATGPTARWLVAQKP